MEAEVYRPLNMRVVVIDLGTSNIQSLVSALTFLGVSPEVTTDSSALLRATHVILPGVGAYDPAMERIEELRLAASLKNYAIAQQKPLLGVCLGMQLLFEGSEEGRSSGLGVLKGWFSRLGTQPGDSFRVPHVGFAQIYDYEETGLFKGLESRSYMYFTHSYALPVTGEGGNIALCNHTTAFVAAFQKGNLCGVQFHPEKSQSSGLQLLCNFLEFC